MRHLQEGACPPSSPHARGRGRRGGRPPAHPPARPPARSSQPGLPIVNIYLTSATPARHRCLLPPPPLAPPGALLPAPGSCRATASPECGRGAQGAGARRGGAGVGAPRASRAVPAPRERPGAPQINASSPSSRVSRGGRARQTQAPPATGAIAAPRIAFVCHSSRSSSSSNNRQAEGGRGGGGSAVRSSASLGLCVEAALADVQTPGFGTAARRARERRPRALGGGTVRPPGERAWASGRVDPGPGREAAPRPRPRPAGRPRRREVLFASRKPWRMVGLSGPVQCKCPREGRPGGRAGGGAGPQAIATRIPMAGLGVGAIRPRARSGAVLVAPLG